LEASRYAVISRCADLAKAGAVLPQISKQHQQPVAS